MTTEPLQVVQSIPVDSIRVLNARSRGKETFVDMVDSISMVGLKRPITVAPAANSDGEQKFVLACGQGRLEAYRALGETTIPALIIEASEDDCYLMSLVENIARRKHTTMDVLRGLVELSERGYRSEDIAKKTNLSRTYVDTILLLSRNGEERVIGAIEKGWLPVKLAIELVRTVDTEMQSAMMEAYRKGDLSTEQLVKVRRMLATRSAHGKRYGGFAGRRRKSTSSHMLVKAYEEEAARQRRLIRRTEINEHRLLFVVSALRRLFRDEHFVTLLRAEGLDSVPDIVAKAIHDR